MLPGDFFEGLGLNKREDCVVRWFLSIAVDVSDFVLRSGGTG